MLTYVINTSENKTFDSSALFELTGYNKIRWLHSSIDDIASCAESICEKQNVLGAEDFRVAVIVDFYNFDRIRKPYGRLGFVEEEGVDMSIYMPYIEAYLLDNLVVYLEKKELYLSDFEVYYVLNEKSERFELFDNARGQLAQILAGDEPAEVYTTEDIRKRRAAAKAVKRIVPQSKKENLYPVLEEIKSRPVDKWERFNMIWQYSDVVVSMPMADRWTIRDYEPNEHRIYSDGAEIGRVVIEEYDDIVKKISAKSFEIGAVTLNHDLRIVDQDGEFIYRYAFDFTFSYERDGETRQNRAIIEINYDEMDKDALDYILKEIIVSTKDDRSFDDKFKQVNDVFYRSFTLYCTSDVSLKFLLTDYPYGATEMTFSQFWKAFRARQAIKTGMRRHYYVVPYGGGSSRAALDTLSLSLYLIRMYEREEITSTEGDMEVFRLDSEVLKEVLESAWSKVNTAKGIAKSKSLQYYALAQFASDTDDTVKEESVKELLLREKNQVLKNIKEGKEKTLSPEAYYARINEISGRRLDALTEKNRHEFDTVMTKYLLKRDATKEADEADEFIELKGLAKVDKCPTKEEYNYLVNMKKRKISALFEKTLASEYIDVSYEEESKKADEAYKEYAKAKTCLNRNLIGDIIFMILTLAMFIVPYILMQLTGFDSGVISSTALALNMTGFFAGLFVLAFLIQMVPLVGKMNVCKKILKSCYVNCRAKESYAFSAIRRKYEKDLIEIEQARYDVRQLKYRFDANIAKSENLARHREMLEKLEDCLSSILNNLDVEPRVTTVENVEEMIDVNKPVEDRSNSIYQVFSIETIEKMFPKKGRD